MLDELLAIGCVKSKDAVDDRVQCLDCKNFPQWPKAQKCLAGEAFWDLSLKMRCISFQANEKNNFWD
jgi:hypothetical protein